MKGVDFGALILSIEAKKNGCFFFLIVGVVGYFVGCVEGCKGVLVVVG